ncbi:hypothetical protein PR202_gb17758 [Eleusine coracana subsp. coracana]|uniref:MAT1 centre domain-containing protein n=1 Tax=Eleusine coracana subsp. coracana TaxID=191504 RepID=A0AAV5F574_ELECO|nr:hypothetical protein PR202_gb17758 [Eleusine coracana subsp. coracana]
MVVTSGGSGNPWAKEMTIRRRMARMCALRPELSRFNKTQEHFPSLRDYNDYLEEVEDMSELPSLFAEDLAAALQASRMNPGKAEASDTAAGSSQGISGGTGAQGQYAPAAVPGGLAQPRPTGLKYSMDRDLHDLSRNWLMDYDINLRQIDWASNAVTKKALS